MSMSANHSEASNSNCAQHFDSCHLTICGQYHGPGEYPDALVKRGLAKEELKNWEGAAKDYTKAIDAPRSHFIKFVLLAKI